ncbi:MAG: histidinol-phosphatase HisJ family protein [bacterium]
MLTDYHLHLRPDEDGTTWERYFTPENVSAYREAATAAGIEELGVSEHVHRFTQALDVWDHPFWRLNAHDDLDAYCEFLAANDLRVGIEADFVPGTEDRMANLLEGRPFDYVVGSVHFLGSDAFDDADYDVWGTHGDPEVVWGRYFESVAEAARSGLFDILAHPDLVKVWGADRPVPERELRHYYEPLVEAVAETGIAVEISTAGLRKPVGEIYPAPSLAAMFAEAGARFCLSSDAHLPEQVGFRYSDAIELLSEIGVDEICTYSGREASMQPLGASETTEVES